MNILLNGNPSEFGENATIDRVVAVLVEDPEPRGLAVAVNGEVVPRHLWRDTSLDDGDRVEVLRAVGGG
ncbi:MAG: sulfur carrier protein ThiS [Actinomycetota bacterium]